MVVSPVTHAAHYITFRLGDELFAINVVQVRELLDMSTITRVPQAPSYMRGVVNVGDRDKVFSSKDVAQIGPLVEAAPELQSNEPQLAQAVLAAVKERESSRAL